MDQWIFALCMLFMHNGHQKEVFAIPPQYSFVIYREAARHDRVLPEEVAAMLVAEHGGGAPYSADSEGAKGERGLLQLADYWRRKYNKINGTTLDKAALLDWHDNLVLGTWAINEMKESHATARRCKIKVWSAEKDENGIVRPILVRQKHTWIAHYRCTFKSRETCKTKWRARLIVKLARWRKIQHFVHFTSAAPGWTESEPVPVLIGLREDS